MVPCPFCRKKIWFERALSSTPKKEQGYNTYYCSNCGLYFVLRRYDSINGKVKGIVTMDVMPNAREVTRRRVHS